MEDCAFPYCSINIRHRFIQFKLIHHVHYSKCKSKDGTLLYLFLICPLIHPFWSSFLLFFCLPHNFLSPDRDLAFFGCSEDSLFLPSHSQTALLMDMVLAQKTYSQTLEDPSTPGTGCNNLFWLSTWI